MARGTGFGILAEEMVTVELEGERTLVPEHSVQTHQSKILYILSIHVNYAVESEVDSRLTPRPDAGNCRVKLRVRRGIPLNRLPFTRNQGVFQASGAPAPHDGADHSRMKPGTWMAYREHGKVPVPLSVLLRVSSWSFVSLRG